MDPLDKSCNMIGANKKLHDELESYYINAIDFTAIDNLYDTLIQKFF